MTDQRSGGARIEGIDEVSTVDARDWIRFASDASCDSEAGSSTSHRPPKIYKKGERGKRERSV